MEKKKSFKPPAKKISLTDIQYEEIFSAVLETQQNSQEKTVTNSPTLASSPGLKTAVSPKESASVENSQNAPSSQTETQNIQIPIPENNTDSTIRTINSEEFSNRAKSSTPTVPNAQTFRSALNNLRKKLNESLSESLNESVDTSLLEIWDQPKLSQYPKGATKRERLQWLQDRRGTGLYVKCDLSSCGKWRWLDIPDPVDVPKVWTCNLNPDEKYNSCQIPEKLIPLEYEEDMIHNKYTAGSIVWAKMPGYPWWPAMVDDCPDCEQYYWLDNILDEEPSSYHVVFFDEGEVSRLWIPEENLLSFKHHLDFDRAFKVKPYQKKRFNISKQKAKEALNLTIKERLKRFSFIALWKKEIPEDSSSESESDSEVPTNSQDFQKYIKKRIYKRRKALSESKSSKGDESQKKNSSSASSKTNKKVNLNKNITIQNTSNNDEIPTSTSTLVESTPKKRKYTKKSPPKQITPRRSPRLSTEKEIPNSQSSSRLSTESTSSLCSVIKVENLSNPSDSDDSVPKKRKPTKSKTPKKITTARRSPRLSTETKNADKLRRLSSETKNVDKPRRLSTESQKNGTNFEKEPIDKIDKSRRLSTKSKDSTESQKNDTNFEKETIDKTPKKRSTEHEEKNKKLQLEKLATPTQSETSTENNFSQSTVDITGIKKQKIKPGLKVKRPFVSPMMKPPSMLNTSSSSFASPTLGPIFEESDN